jgi:hypothetical protein
VGERIGEIKKKAEALGNLFKDYRILIVENDSSDGTRDKLLAWAAQNPKVTILGCGHNAPQCKIPKTPKTDGHGVDRPRIEKMVYLRNIYLQEIKERYADSDYVAVWDLDSIGSVYLDGVAHTMGLFGIDPEISVVCANGIYRWGSLTLFYDSYATVDKGEVFHIDMKTPHDIRKGLLEHQHVRGDNPIEVESCFSGFAIYKTQDLLDKNVFYDMSDETNLECEHTRLNKKIKGRKIINPSMINLILLND